MASSRRLRIFDVELTFTRLEVLALEKSAFDVCAPQFPGHEAVAASFHTS